MHGRKRTNTRGDRLDRAEATIARLEAWAQGVAPIINALTAREVARIKAEQPAQVEPEEPAPNAPESPDA